MLALFGIGKLGQSLYYQLKKQNVNVDFLLDNHKNNTIFDGIEILPPVQISNEARAQTTVIISTFKQELQKDELNQLRISLLKLGFKEVLNLQQAIKHFGLDFEYFYVGKSSIEHGTSAKVLALLSDEISKQTFQAHLDFRVTGNVDTLHQSLYQEDQYVPDFFVNYLKSLETPLRIVDCGACFGDLLTATLQKSIPVWEYLAFEPDNNNREKLAHRLSNEKSKAVIFPAGVGDGEMDLNFSSGEGMASHFDENGTQRVKIVTLDETVFGDVHWIKMDVEGFEQEALTGGKRIIKDFAPALCISLYHKPNDIITLPLYLSRYYSKLYIRQHGRYGFDLVLYCFN
jgi:FkbM family methyltransferase